MYGSQDIFYEVQDEKVQVFIKCHRYMENEKPSNYFTSFMEWMAESFPNKPMKKVIRVDGFFGDGDFMNAMDLTMADLTLIKLVWKIKSRSEWIEEYHHRTRVMFEELKRSVDALNNSELLWRKQLFSEESK